MQKILLLFLALSGLVSTGCAGGTYRERVYVGAGYNGGYRHGPPPPPPAGMYQQPAYIPPPPPPPSVIVVQQTPPPPAYGSPGYGPSGYGHGHGRGGSGKSTTVVNNTTVVVAPTTTVQTGGRGRAPAPASHPAGRVYAQPTRRHLSRGLWPFRSTPFGVSTPTSHGVGFFVSRLEKNRLSR